MPLRLALVVLAAALATESRGQPVATGPQSVTWTSATFSSDGAFLLTYDSVSGVQRSRGSHLFDARTGQLVDVTKFRRAFVDDPVRTRDRQPWMIEWGERNRVVTWSRPDRRESTHSSRSRARGSSKPASPAAAFRWRTS
jgi:hypothetical protein